MTGYAYTGSFCTHALSFAAMERLIAEGEDIIPIFSDTAYNTDTRFGMAADFRSAVETACGRKIVHTVTEAERFGPSLPLDAMIIAPCTGNTLAKLASGITDTPVCMSAKAHLRSSRPLLLAVASNDALSANLSNIAEMLNRKNVWLVPMRQDDPLKKPHSLVSDFSLLPHAFAAMKRGEQLRPVFI